MADSNVNVERAQKRGWWKGLKAEFKKIIWPDKKSLIRETIAVVVLSVLMCLIILAVDAVIKFGLDAIL